MSTLVKHYVTFLSPGTFFAEETSHEIDKWDVDSARAEASRITERYGAVPYGFQFTTRERGDDDFNSREVARSGIYYLGCIVLTEDDVRARNDPNDDTLLANMKANGWKRVVQTTKGYRWTQPLRDEDVVLDSPAVLTAGAPA